jgi:aspartyl-tRNA(Asn)/glutamyl-tRNA(Gln) amidotransferase subunit C
MAIQVTDDLVRHIAGLSRLAISPAETAELKKHFEKILAFIADFQDLDTAGVDPSIFSVEAFNVFRADEVESSLSPEQVFQNAPAVRDSQFVVPRIVGGVEAEEP